MLQELIWRTVQPTRKRQNKQCFSSIELWSALRFYLIFELRTFNVVFVFNAVVVYGVKANLATEDFEIAQKRQAFTAKKRKIDLPLAINCNTAAVVTSPASKQDEVQWIRSMRVMVSRVEVMPPRQVAAYSTDEQIPNSIKEVTAYSTPQDGSDVEKLRAELAEMKKRDFD
ncbi:hypothetical protein DAPPUDRAFT_100180 [Daphnia pulex]|uniref:Uncharacterized protein n=1 Tax=Daphnia pulex TaxID=6669 RepID=E9G9M5_DAPPU|nr:hypothetical protein DAPPUDRAFT_100180 [Daphnia pulex]|eukprot:EFX83587.1 hypothetical protein DAPPUDRAFT_100180 [Daphnia pulex]